MKIDKKTFCIAPWFEIKSSSMGKFSVCCQIRHENSEFKGKKEYEWPKNTPSEFFNSEYVKYLREQLNSGNKLPECSKCWESEKLTANRSSLRKSLNNTYINESYPDWLSLFFKNKKDFSSHITLYADVALSNVCNFACITCNPAESSKIYTKWKKDQNHKIVKKLIDSEKDYFKRIDILNKSGEKPNLLRHILEINPKSLKLVGGEPLVNKKELKYLSELDEKVKKDITINFVTNGSKSLVQNDILLNGFKNIFYTISLEGTGKIQDYIREGSDWEIIKTNIEEYRKINPTKHLSVLCVLQALNSYHIGDLNEWCKKLDIGLDFIILDTPDFMSVESIPPSLREKIINQNNKRNEKINLDFFQLFNEMPFSKKKQKELKDFLDWNDPSQKWKKLFPEWVSIFK